MKNIMFWVFSFEQIFNRELAPGALEDQGRLFLYQFPTVKRRSPPPKGDGDPFLQEIDVSAESEASASRQYR
jgi:hypothetical protein